MISTAISAASDEATSPLSMQSKKTAAEDASGFYGDKSDVLDEILGEFKDPEAQEEIQAESIDVELAEAKLRYHSESLEKQTATLLIDLKKHADSLAHVFESCLLQLNVVHENFDVSFLHFKNLKTDLAFIQTCSDSLQTETDNQRTLYQQLSKIVDVLHFSSRVAAILVEPNSRSGDLNSPPGIRHVQDALNLFSTKFLSLPFNNKFDTMVATKQRFQAFKDMLRQFCDRILAYFKNFFSEQSSLMKSEKYRFPLTHRKKSSSLQLVGHEAFFNRFFQFKGICGTIETLHPETHQQLQELYKSSFISLYQREIDEFCQVIESFSLKKVFFFVVFDESAKRYTKEAASSVGFVDAGSFSKDEKFPVHLLWEFAIRQILPIVLQERELVSRIFVQNLSLQNNSEPQRRTDAIMKDFYESIQKEMAKCAGIFCKADPSAIFEMIVITQHAEEYFLDASSKQSSFDSPEECCMFLKDVHALFSESQEKFIEEQLVHIHNQTQAFIKHLKKDGATTSPSSSSGAAAFKTIPGYLNVFLVCAFVLLISRNLCNRCMELRPIL